MASAVNGTAPALSEAELLQWEYLLGSSTLDGRRYEWLVTRTGGVYRLEFRFIDQVDEVQHQNEYGEWSLSGPIYFTLPRAAEENGKIFDISRDGPEFGIAFHILSLNPEEIVVRAYSDNS